MSTEEDKIKRAFQNKGWNEINPYTLTPYHLVKPETGSSPTAS